VGLNGSDETCLKLSHRITAVSRLCRDRDALNLCPACRAAK
jgi:hypothetical protein